MFHYFKSILNFKIVWDRNKTGIVINNLNIFKYVFTHSGLMTSAMTSGMTSDMTAERPRSLGGRPTNVRGTTSVMTSVMTSDVTSVVRRSFGRTTEVVRRPSQFRDEFREEFRDEFRDQTWEPGFTQCIGEALRRQFFWIHHMDRRGSSDVGTVQSCLLLLRKILLEKMWNKMRQKALN